MRALGKFGVILVAVLSIASSATAGELIPAVGTDAWLVPPQGFAPVAVPARGFTLGNGTGGAIVVSQAMPHGLPTQFDLDQLAADPAKLEQAALMFPNGKAEIVPIGEAKFLLIGGDIPASTGNSGKIWLAMSGEAPMISFSFAQFGIGGTQTINRPVIEQVLASVVVLRGSQSEAGVSVGGLFLPALAPFSYAELTDVGSARLRTVADKTAKGLPKISLGFAMPDDELVTLDQIGAKSLGYGDVAKLVGSSDTELLGVPAQREVWSATFGDKQVETIGYVAVYGGQRVILSVAGPPDQMTAEITSTFDKIAGALAPGEKPE